MTLTTWAYAGGGETEDDLVRLAHQRHEVGGPRGVQQLGAHRDRPRLRRSSR
ncbi:hypothetical protein [Micromonospora sp. RTP1Z1]|uniref:hypothetical protein n=1 Tax=Micromonospora sp. RTP1Z1 TaxID=2994043 RepID=UPI0029C93DE4|nr:hypothetical protein [Micromonospora sp. RTP1Z1]